MGWPLRIVVAFFLALVIGSLVPLYYASATTPQVNAGSLPNGLELAVPQLIVLLLPLFILPAAIFVLSGALRVHPKLGLPVILFVSFILITPPINFLVFAQFKPVPNLEILYYSRMLQLALVAGIILWGMRYTLSYLHDPLVVQQRLSNRANVIRRFLVVSVLVVLYYGVDLAMWLFGNPTGIQGASPLYLQLDLSIQAALIPAFIALVIYWAGSDMAEWGTALAETGSHFLNRTDARGATFLLTLVFAAYVLWDALAPRIAFIGPALLLTACLALVLVLVVKFARITMQWKTSVPLLALLLGVIFLYCTNLLGTILGIVPFFSIKTTWVFGQAYAASSAFTCAVLAMGIFGALLLIARGRHAGREGQGMAGLLLLCTCVIFLTSNLPFLLNGIRLRVMGVSVVTIDSIRVCAAMFVLVFVSWLWINRNRMNSDLTVPLSRSLIFIFGLQMVSWLLHFFQFLGNLTLLPTIVTATIFIGAIIWDFVTSGREVTNGDTPTFPHGARVFLYLGYTLIATAVLLYSGSMHIAGIDAPNPTQTGVDTQTSGSLLLVGVPIIIVEYVVGIARWRQVERAAAGVAQNAAPRAYLVSQLAIIGSGLVAMLLVAGLIGVTLLPVIRQPLGSPYASAAYIAPIPGNGCDAGGALWRVSLNVTPNCSKNGLVLQTAPNHAGTVEFIQPEGLGYLPESYSVGVSMTMLTPFTDPMTTHYCGNVIVRYTDAAYTGTYVCDNGAYDIDHYTAETRTHAITSYRGQAQIALSYAILLTVDGSKQTLLIAGNGGVTSRDMPYHAGERIGFGVTNYMDEPVSVRFRDFIYLPAKGHTSAALLPQHTPAVPPPPRGYQTLTAPGAAWSTNVPTGYAATASSYQLPSDHTKLFAFHGIGTVLVVTQSAIHLQQTEIEQDWVEIIHTLGAIVKITDVSPYRHYAIGPYAWNGLSIGATVNGVPWQLSAFSLMGTGATYTFVSATLKAATTTDVASIFNYALVSFTILTSSRLPVNSAQAPLPIPSPTAPAPAASATTAVREGTMQDLAETTPSWPLGCAYICTLLHAGLYAQTESSDLISWRQDTPPNH